MPPLTGKVPGNGTSTLSYTIPSAGLDVESVYATIDTSGAAGAVTAELTVADQSGAVIARKVQNTTVDQGITGSATWALQLLDDCLTAPSGTFPQTVLTIAPANTLRGYWRLGEVAAPMADSSGWSGGPTNLATAGAGAAPTFHIAGALPFGQDDGAIQINGGVGTGQFLHNASSAVNTGINTGFSIAGWMKPSASAATIIGGIYNNVAPSGGQEYGWQLTGVWSAGVTYVYLRRIIAGAVLAASTPVTTGAWTFVVGTYDGANLRLYTNGALIATTADARADVFNPYSNVDLGMAVFDPALSQDSFLGGLDEVAVWGHVLTASDVATLYAAAQV